MGVINVLDKHVAELIAAGEVVERPASVIKELIENSIDAGAKHITVEIKNGGITFMRVADDGCGIYKDDIKIAFMRHATSKVKIQNDLDCISTLGFRGEALASICAVSRLQLITRNINESVGTCYEIDGGEEISFDDAGCPVGTTFIIRDLFYNIPARAKFLKKDVSEGNAVSNIVDKTALSHPEISFTYIKDGKQALKTFGDGKLISAIYSVMGKDFANSLIPVDYQLDAVKVTGYITKPEHARSNRNMQNFFINGRYIKTRTAMAALEEAFKTSIMVGKFPSCVINIELPFEVIDVNVHPSKLEVRFVNERPVFDTIYHAVKSSLMKYDGRKKAAFKSDSAFNDIGNRFNPFHNAPAILDKKEPAVKEFPVRQSKVEKDKIDEFEPFEKITHIKNIPNNHSTVLDDIKLADSGKPFDIYKQAVVQNEKHKPIFENTAYKAKTDSFITTEDTTVESPENDIEIETNRDLALVNTEESKESEKKEPVLIKQDEINVKYIGEAFSTYIIAEKNNNEILLIDKHAAHERIIYEKLKADTSALYSQLLLQPATVTLGKIEYDAAINNIEMFSACGFEVEDFGNSTVIVRSVPQYIDASEVPDCIAEMADYISQGKNDIYTEKMDWFYHNVSCRAAIKAGNRSTPQEMIDIIKQLEENPQIKYCPHGRPICIVLSKNDIEKQFGRV